MIRFRSLANVVNFLLSFTMNIQAFPMPRCTPVYGRLFLGKNPKKAGGHHRREVQGGPSQGESEGFRGNCMAEASKLDFVQD